MKDFFKRNKLFLALCLAFFVTLGGALLFCDKGDMHILMNPEHTAGADFFMRYYTLVGEWIPYIVVGLLLFYKVGWSLFLLADVAISGLIGQGLKYAFNTDRPLTWFAKYMPEVKLELVDGVTMSEWYSFPSGHTTTFFALFFTLAIIIKESKLKCQETWITLCFAMAVLGGFSRIYLNQHFAEDIWGGALLGTVTTILLYAAVPYLQSKEKFWNWNILHFFEKK